MPRRAGIKTSFAFVLVVVLIAAGPELAVGQSLYTLEDSLAAGGRFGSATAIDGSHLLVGSPTADQYGENSGMVSVFRPDTSGWGLHSRLESAGVGENDQLGSSIAIDDSLAVVGAHGDDELGSNAGAAYVFAWRDTAWVEQAKLTVENLGENANLGRSVDISGNRIILGAPSIAAADTVNNTGGAYIFVRGTSGWTVDTLLTAHDPASGDKLGSAVALDGNYAAASARFRDVPSSEAGGVYVFGYSDGEWRRDTTLTAPEPQEGAIFGSSVALTGGRIAVGAYGDSTAGADAGAVHTFRRGSGRWNLEQTLTADDASPDSWFGYSVAMDSTTIAAGAVYSDRSGNDSGAGYIFRYNDGTWVQEAAPQPDTVSAGYVYGYSAAVDAGNGAVFGAYAGGAWYYGSPPEPTDTTASPPDTTETPVARESSELPEELALRANYPNPFNPTTTIPYEVGTRVRVRLEIYNVRGRLIAQLVDRVHSAGRYNARWNAAEYPSGVYFYRLSTPTRTRTQSMVLVK